MNDLAQRDPSAAIDIEQILKKRFPRIPSFLCTLVRKIIRQDFLNGFFVQGYEGVEFCEECLKYIGAEIQVEGIDNLPLEGRFTIASNHPLGGVDALAVNWIAGRRYDGAIRFQANDFLMNIKGLAPLMVPVNKVGAQSRDLLSRTEEIYNSDYQVVVFPSGKVSRKQKGIIEDPDWKKSFIKYSISSQRDIVPVHFYGKNSWRFYALDRIGKLFRSKFPLAMILLPDELYRCKGKKFRMVIGEPIPWRSLDESRSHAAWAEVVKRRVYEL